MPCQYADSRPITLPADEPKPLSDHFMYTYPDVRAALDAGGLERDQNEFPALRSEALRKNLHRSTRIYVVRHTGHPTHVDTFVHRWTNLT